MPENTRICLVMMRLLLLLILIMAFSAPIKAEETSLFESSGLPIPRFVSLRSDKVFVRTGPALRYPVKWIFQKKNLPVEVIQEFDTWRKVRDSAGDEGWIHQSLLSGRRTVLISGDGVVPMRRDPSENARLSAQVEPRVVAELLRCVPGWCEIKAQGYRGWSQRNLLWGIYDGEELN